MYEYFACFHSFMVHAILQIQFTVTQYSHLYYQTLPVYELPVLQALLWSGSSGSGTIYERFRETKKIGCEHEGERSAPALSHKVTFPPNNRVSVERASHAAKRRLTRGCCVIVSLSFTRV